MKMTLTNTTGVVNADVAPTKSSLLQTLSIFYYFFVYLWSMLFSIAITLLVIVCPPLWFIAIFYSFWYYYDWRSEERGGHLWKPMRNRRIFKYMAAYFPIRMVKTAELPPNKNYIIVSHPHGIFNIGTLVSLGSEGTGFSTLFPGLSVYLCTLPINFVFPFRRELIMLNGLISSSKKAIGSILGRNQEGNVVVLVPGGAEEALEAHPTTYNLVLRSRKGFIRLALKYGADLVPCYHFGEQKIFHQWPNPPNSRLRNWQHKFKRLTGMTPPIFWGKSIFNILPFGFMPFQQPIVTVVGSPITVHQTSNPTETEVDELHERYCAALVHLFDKYKLSYDSDCNAQTKLTII